MDTQTHGGKTPREAAACKPRRGSPEKPRADTSISDSGLRNRETINFCCLSPQPVALGSGGPSKLAWLELGARILGVGPGPGGTAALATWASWAGGRPERASRTGQALLWPFLLSGAARMWPFTQQEDWRPMPHLPRSGASLP